MATTNLISKSLGDILTESGNGTPDHVSPKGSLYTDKDTGKLYQNKDGSTFWVHLNSVAYGEVDFSDNTNVTTINTQNVWETVNATFIEGDVMGFSAGTNTLTVLNGYDGVYDIKCDATIQYVAGTNNYEIGLSLNGNDPVSGSYQGALVDVTYTRQHIGFNVISSLSGGTTLGIDVRNRTNTDNIIVRNTQLIATKIG